MWKSYNWMNLGIEGELSVGSNIGNGGISGCEGAGSCPFPAGVVCFLHQVVLLNVSQTYHLPRLTSAFLQLREQQEPFSPYRTAGTSLPGVSGAPSDAGRLWAKQKHKGPGSKRMQKKVQT